LSFARTLLGRQLWLVEQPLDGIPVSELTPEMILETAETGAKDLAAKTHVAPMVIDLEGQPHLVLFSRVALLEDFLKDFSVRANKVFGFQVLAMRGWDLVPSMLAIGNVVVNPGTDRQRILDANELEFIARVSSV
jgi:hypothetical protein